MPLFLCILYNAVFQYDGKLGSGSPPPPPAVSGSPSGQAGAAPATSPPPPHPRPVRGGRGYIGGGGGSARLTRLTAGVRATQGLWLQLILKSHADRPFTTDLKKISDLTLMLMLKKKNVFRVRCTFNRHEEINAAMITRSAAWRCLDIFCVNIIR
jgi:hypothetical protein